MGSGYRRGDHGRARLEAGAHRGSGDGGNNRGIRKSLAEAVKQNTAFAYKGETKSLAEWSRRFQIDYDVLKSRVRRYGWTIEKAIETPVKNRR